jgi:hypothetical protein
MKGHRDAGVTAENAHASEVLQVTDESPVTNTIESDVTASLGRKGAN